MFTTEKVSYCKRAVHFKIAKYLFKHGNYQCDKLSLGPLIRKSECILNDLVSMPRKENLRSHLLAAGCILSVN
jgi:hypothetical protein